MRLSSSKAHLIHSLSTDGTDCTPFCSGTPSWPKSHGRHGEETRNKVSFISCALSTWTKISSSLAKPRSSLKPQSLWVLRLPGFTFHYKVHFYLFIVNSYLQIRNKILHKRFLSCFKKIYNQQSVVCNYIQPPLWANSLFTHFCSYKKIIKCKTYFI